jgi:hypothetical protein
VRGIAIKSNLDFSPSPNGKIQTMLEKAWSSQRPIVPMLGISSEGFPYNRQGYLRPCNVDKLRVELYGRAGKNLMFQPSFMHQLVSNGFRRTPTFDGPFDEQFNLKKGPVNFWFADGFRFRPLNRLIQVNPSYFPDFKALEAFMALAVKDFEPGKSKIVQVDISFDLPIEILQLRSITQIKGYRRLDASLTQTGNMTLYFGAEEKIKIYDKGIKLGLERGVITRIELHLEGKKLPRLSFEELPRLGQMNLFQKLKLQEVTVPAARYGSLKDFEVLQRLQGFEVAKRTLGRNRNFTRDVEKRLNYGEAFSLDPYVQWGLSEFFNARPVENKPSIPIEPQLVERSHE